MTWVRFFSLVVTVPVMLSTQGVGGDYINQIIQVKKTVCIQERAYIYMLEFLVRKHQFNLPAVYVESAKFMERPETKLLFF